MIKMTPEKNAIDAWKEKWENIYSLEIGDQEGQFSHTFYFREISKKEYNNLLLSDLNQAVLEEEVCSLCVLYPEFDFSNPYERAGIAKILADHILNESYLLEGQAEELLELYRQEMQYLDFQTECIIHEAFPYIPLEEISNWTIQKTMYYLSRAEFILRELRGVPLSYVDPNATAEGQQQAYQNNFVNENQMQQQENMQPSQQLEPKQVKEGHLPEDELLKMLAQEEAKHGRDINYRQEGMDQMMPELSWFKAEEEIMGDFD